MSYDIMLAYTRPDYPEGQSLDHDAERLAHTLGMDRPHSTNLPCFGVMPLDYGRTLEWTVNALPDDPLNMLTMFRSEVPEVHGFAVRRSGMENQPPILYWQDHVWVETASEVIREEFKQTAKGEC